MAFVVWITGLPGSGKSTIADELKARVPDAVILRMDDFRRAITPTPTYSDQERDLLYRSLVYLAGILYRNGHNVIIDATANLRRWRDFARKSIEVFFEVYLRCPLDECRRREESRMDTRQAPKDIYRKAEEGWPVPGVNVPYEEPLNAEITIDSEKTGITETVRVIVDFLNRGFSKVPSS